MKIYRFNKILVAAALLPFVSQAMLSGFHKSTPDYNKPSKEMLEVLHEADKDRSSEPFTSKSNPSEFAFRDEAKPVRQETPFEAEQKAKARKRREEAEKKLKALETHRQEELREEAREAKKELRRQRIRSQGIGFGKVVPVDVYADDANHLRSMFNAEERRKSGESHAPLVEKAD